jgi:hypothetical protein
MDKLDEVVGGGENEVAVRNDERCAILDELARVRIQMPIPRHAKCEELGVVYETAIPW